MAETSSSPEQTWVIPAGTVRQCVDALLSRRANTFFIAYLHLRRRAAQAGTLTGVTPNWAELSEYLRVRGGPRQKPLLRPFWPAARNARQEWMKDHLVGSYGPSSIRENPARVIETDSEGRYNFKERHWELARQHLLFGEPISALALGGYLFRDFGIVSPTPPTPDDILALFRSEFGYGPEDDEEFDYLYDADQLRDAAWAEPWSSEPPA